MNPSCVILLSILAVVRCDWKFPPGFKFGAATSAFQIEGTANLSESIWHKFTHRAPSLVADGSTADVSCDSYNLWREDVRMVEELGLDYYRFSISWPRLLPGGLPPAVSAAGARYYGDLIDALLARGVEPVVTLYHWDLPQRLQDLGGWTNPLIADWFADYSRMVFSLFGDRVKTWITINEPTIMCELAYIIGVMPPGVVDYDKGYMLCVKHTMMAHAKAWRLYDEEFRMLYDGKVSYNNGLVFFEPLTEGDQEAADLANHYLTGIYSHPVYSKEGGWPPHIEKLVAEYSKERGFHGSMMPEFTEEERKFVRGTYDFYAFSYYLTRTARKARKGEEISYFLTNGLPPAGIIAEARPEWKAHLYDYFTVYPEGLRHQLLWLKQQYGDIEFRIMENGCPDGEGGLQDDDRIQVLKANMEQVLLSIKEDGVNVTHYTVWSLMDNFEWMSGYTPKFGLYAVDFTSRQRTRTPRASARFYADVIKMHSLDVPISRINDEL